MELTNSQQALLDQIIWLQNHFEFKFGIEAFSQSNAQFQSKLGLSRKTIQTGIQKLEELGVIEVARNMGYKGANLIFLHKSKIQRSLESLSDIAKSAMKKTIEMGRTMEEFAQATAMNFVDVVPVASVVTPSGFKNIEGRMLSYSECVSLGYDWEAH